MQNFRAKLGLFLLACCLLLQAACGGEPENQQPTDTTPPSVISTLPANQDSDVSRNAQITVSFSEEILESSVNASTFEVIDSSGNNIAGRYTFGAEKSTVRFTPTQLLNAFSNYTVALNDGITDTAGNALHPRHSLQFFTR